MADSNPKITIGGKGFEGVIARFNINCVIDIKVTPKSEGCDWTSFTIEGNTVKLIADPYDGDESRTCTYTIAYTAETDTKGGTTGCTKEVDIEQLSKNVDPPAPDPCNKVIVDGGFHKDVIPSTGNEGNYDTSYVDSTATFVVEIYTNLTDEEWGVQSSEEFYDKVFSQRDADWTGVSESRYATVDPVTTSEYDYSSVPGWDKKTFFNHSRCVAAKLQWQAAGSKPEDKPACMCDGCDCNFDYYTTHCPDPPDDTHVYTDVCCKQNYDSSDAAIANLTYMKYSIAANDGDKRLIAVWWVPPGKETYGDCFSALNLFKQEGNSGPEPIECNYIIVDGTRVYNPIDYWSDSSRITDEGRFTAELYTNIKAGVINNQDDLENDTKLNEAIQDATVSIVGYSESREGTISSHGVTVGIRIQSRGDDFWENNPCVAATLQWEANGSKEEDKPECIDHNCSFRCWENPTPCDDICRTQEYTHNDQYLGTTYYEVLAEESDKDRIIIIYWYPEGGEETYKMCPSKRNIVYLSAGSGPTPTTCTVYGGKTVPGYTLAIGEQVEVGTFLNCSGTLTATHKDGSGVDFLDDFDFRNGVIRARVSEFYEECADKTRKTIYTIKNGTTEIGELTVTQNSFGNSTKINGKSISETTILFNSDGTIFGEYNYTPDVFVTFSNLPFWVTSLSGTNGKITGSCANYTETPDREDKNVKVAFLGKCGDRKITVKQKGSGGPVPPYWETGLPVVVIDTENQQPIVDKENWIGGSIKIYDSNKTLVTETSDFDIRGRGNSTWNLPKKPYAIKFDNKTSVLGMNKSKRWCLLADYEDRTLMRNHITFEVSKLTGLDYTPSGEFVELVLNGEYAGSYYLCEQIKVEENRIDIDEFDDYLLEIDSYYDEDNKFTSSTYSFPYNIKSPDNPTVETIKNKIDTIESELKNGSYDKIDLESFADYFIVEELVGNLECRFNMKHLTDKYHGPHSVYTQYIVGNNEKIKMGPVWDFDNTFALTLNQRAMEEYSDIKDLGDGQHMAELFVVNDTLYYKDLFKISEFKQVVKTRWNGYYSNFQTKIPPLIEATKDLISKSWELDREKWFTDEQKTVLDTETENMITYFNTKLSTMNTEINKW